jgi:rhodanese-related sulfurtransferase
MKMNSIRTAMFFSVFMTYAVCLQAATPDYRLITTGELKQLLDAGAPMTIIDSRNPEEYQEVHILRAINIPEKKLGDHLAMLPADKASRLVFYCNGVKCGKSKRSAEKVLKLGYDNIFIYAEGMPVWEEQGLPIHAGPDYEKRIETTIVTARDLGFLLQSGAGTFTVVDVRDPEEFKEGHMPGAINIPVATFALQSGVLDKEKKIIVYCNSGGRSYNAYRKLLKLGYENINQAIFADWKEAGLPVEKL